MSIKRGTITPDPERYPYRCPRGHRWNPDTPHTSPTACPTCGWGAEENPEWEPDVRKGCTLTVSGAAYTAALSPTLALHTGTVLARYLSGWAPRGKGRTYVYVGVPVEVALDAAWDLRNLGDSLLYADADSRAEGRVLLAAATRIEQQVHEQTTNHTTTDTTPEEHTP